MCTEKRILEGQKIIARKTYNELIEVITVLRITNPLFTDIDISEKTGLIIDACTYRICDLMGWDKEGDFFLILDSLFDELTFDELLDKIEV